MAETQNAKPKRRRPDSGPQVSPSDVSRYVNHNMTIMQWKRPDLTDLDAVTARINEYFSLCEQNGVKPSVEALALAFSTDRKSLWLWANGMRKNIPPGVVHTLKMAYNLMTTMMADYMQNGNINPVAGIFLMKNNHGYEDKTETVLTPNMYAEQKNSREDIQRYLIETAETPRIAEHAESAEQAEGAESRRAAEGAESAERDFIPLDPP